MRRNLLAAAAVLLAATASHAGDAPAYFRGAYVTPANRPVLQMRPTVAYVNGQRVERAAPVGYAIPYPRYVDRPGASVPPPAAAAGRARAYPVVTGSWQSPGR